MAQLRQSPLRDRHEAAGARLTGFGGFEMPLHYGSVIEEHHAVRHSCGIFDVSHLGTLRVTGPDAEAALQHAFSNDITAIDEGQCQYTLCLDDDAGIVDDLIVSRFEWGFWVAPNAANAGAVAALLKRSAGDGDCRIEDVNEATASVAVQGPRAADVLAAAGIDTDGLQYMHGRVIALPGADLDSSGGTAAAPADRRALLTRTGYTGELGYEIVVAAEVAGEVWDRIVAAGARPAGLGCRDTLRLEMGYPLHGNDITVATNPVEARLGWAVKQGTGFRGEEAYTAAKQRGPTRLLWGLRALARGIPRAGQQVLRGDEVVGETTSGTFSPTGNVGIALGYLVTGITAGDHVEIDVRGRRLAAEVLRPPFVQASPR